MYSRWKGHQIVVSHLQFWIAVSHLQVGVVGVRARVLARDLLAAICIHVQERTKPRASARTTMAYRSVLLLLF